MYAIVALELLLREATQGNILSAVCYRSGQIMAHLFMIQKSLVQILVGSNMGRIALS